MSQPVFLTQEDIIFVPLAAKLNL